MAWLAHLARGEAPVDQVHVMLYGYFPQVALGDDRPFVWRLIGPDTIAVMSRLRPAANGAREMNVAAGLTYDFRLTCKRQRNCGGSYTDKDGERRPRKARPVTITLEDEVKERIRRHALRHGGDVRYVRIENMRELRMGDIRLPICDAVGKIFVTDAAAFETLLTGGGPGTGKAYGLGMWWLPELMTERCDAAT